ncbi:MAG: hypothetical protein ACWIPH_05100 [Ostreibacterium sp.]
MMALRQTIVSILEGDNQHYLSRWMNMIIIVTVVSFILGSVASLEVKFSPIFHIIEVFSLAIFALEYLLRFWSSPDQ